MLRASNKVQISAQLIDARSDRPIWARTYERDFTSGLAWQGEVAQAIADEISINVTPQEQARLARNRPIDPEAQDLYLRGLLQLEADDCKSAVEFFNKAIDKNPNYAQAHAALANCYGCLLYTSLVIWNPEPPEDVPGPTVPGTRNSSVDNERRFPET